jgi:hypothetical protein
MSTGRHLWLFFRILLWVMLGVYALTKVKPRQHYGHHRSLRCPRCRHHFPRLDNEGSGETIPTGGYTCEHCGCRTDEFGNEFSGPADRNDPKSW